MCIDIFIKYPIFRTVTVYHKTQRLSIIFTQITGGDITVKSRISNKLYGALLRCGTPPEIAANIAGTTDFLGESTEETREKDNYEIMVAAKALSAVIARHSDKPSAEKALSSEPIRENAVIKLSEPDAANSDELPEFLVKGKFWRWLRSKPSGVRTTLSVIIPTLLHIGMILLSVLAVTLTAVCLVSMVAMTVAGIAMFIIGLLYGVTQLNSFPAAAYFEIGLGLILGGAAALLLVLFYNVVTGLLPTALKLGIKKLTSYTHAFRRFKLSMREPAGKS